jgi:four helix bundle protein
MQTHKDLNVWKKSVDVAADVYNITSSFPKEELFGIVSQMRRAAISIPSNIAEGYGRNTPNEILHFLYISSGSASELDTQIVLSKRIGLIDDTIYNKLTDNITLVRKMLSSLITSVKQNIDK